MGAGGLLADGPGTPEPMAARAEKLK